MPTGATRSTPPGRAPVSGPTDPTRFADHSYCGRMTNLEAGRRTPPRWLNGLMGLMLRAPGLQRLPGRSTALLTFTGRKSGTIYVTPISYVRDGDSVILTCHRSRQWWRNIASRPEVQVRLAGTDYAGTARVVRDDDALSRYIEFLENQPRIARASGVDLDPSGRANPEKANAALVDTVVVVVDLEARSPQDSAGAQE